MTFRCWRCRKLNWKEYYTQVICDDCKRKDELELV